MNKPADTRTATDVERERAKDLCNQKVRACLERAGPAITPSTALDLATDIAFEYGIQFALAHASHTWRDVKDELPKIVGDNSTAQGETK